jgi:hypothetical protein
MQTVHITGASGFVGPTLFGMARGGEFAGTARMPNGVAYAHLLRNHKSRIFSSARYA